VSISLTVYTVTPFQNIANDHTDGWLKDKDDVVKPWRILGQDSEVFALRYEMNALITLGASLQNMVSSYAWSAVKIEILKRTVLATLWSALWPVYLLYVILFFGMQHFFGRLEASK